MEKAKAAKEATSTVGAETISHRPDAPPPSAGLPKKIGRFNVLAKLGEGAFGQVFRARDPQLERDVAIKVQKLGALATAEERERFAREAKAAAAIQHPNICPVYEVNADGDALFIVMAYIPGASLAEQLRARKTTLAAKQSALIVRKLAQALHAAHCKGIVHRDLKPGNILFDKERKDVVITDFGLARRAQSKDVELTQNGAILGTPAYMSPEQARGDTKEVGPASDIYSLGVILYELLTGKKPFTGSIGEVLGKVQHIAPEPPSKLRTGIDARLESICLKAMAKAPKDRFGSMREFAYQLGEYLKVAPTGAVQPGLPDAKKPAEPSEAAQMAEIIAAMSIERQAETKAVEQSHRKLGRLVLGVGGCLGLLMLMLVCSGGGLGVWLYQRGENVPPGTVVSVLLQDITHLHDNSVHYYLNGDKIDSKKLEGRLKLSIGDYELVGKRGDDVVETRTFRIEPYDNEKEIVTLPTEPDRPEGPIHSIKHVGNISDVAVSPDGRWLMAVHSAFSMFSHRSSSIVGLWDLDSGEKLREEPILDAERVAFTPNSKQPYLGFRGGRAFVLRYDLENPKLWKDRLRFECTRGYQTTSLDTSRDGKTLLMGTYHDGAMAINVWNTADAKPIASMDGAYIASLTPDGQRFFAAKENDLILHEIRGDKPKPIETYKGHQSAINAVACSHDGRMVAAGAVEPTNGVRAWGVDTGKPLDHFQRHKSAVMCLRFSPDDRRLLSAGADGVLRVSDVRSGNVICETPPQGAPITCAVFSPGGRRAVFGMNDGTIKIWQLPK